MDHWRSSSPKPHKCDIDGCTKSFSTSAHLARHQVNHTGVRKYKCDVPGCTSMFFRADTSLQHSRAHRRRLGQDPDGGGGSSQSIHPQQQQRQQPQVQATASSDAQFSTITRTLSLPTQHQHQQQLQLHYQQYYPPANVYQGFYGPHRGHSMQHFPQQYSQDPNLRPPILAPLRSKPPQIPPIQTDFSSRRPEGSAANDNGQMMKMMHQSPSSSSPTTSISVLESPSKPKTSISFLCDDDGNDGDNKRGVREEEGEHDKVKD